AVGSCGGLTNCFFCGSYSAHCAGSWWRWRAIPSRTPTRFKGWVGHQRGGPFPDSFSDGPPPNRTCRFPCIRLSSVPGWPMSVELPGVERRVALPTEDQRLSFPDDHQPLPPYELLLLQE